jgi:formylglycine-generating enzyme required for sulfatase activity
MVYIPAGEFIMGSADENVTLDEKPAHKIILKAYYIDKCEVTNSQYQQFIQQTGHPAPFVDAEWAAPYNWHGVSFPEGMANYPVVLVTWDDARTYAQWAGKRLPTEAEWEKAARGGLISQKYPYGNTLELHHANFYKGFMRKRSLMPVGSFVPGGFGLYDMAGNVWEWCQDWYDDAYYKITPSANPQGPAEGLYRVMRGGCWINDKNYLRCAQRSKNVPENRSHLVGFRCILSAALDL